MSGCDPGNYEMMIEEYTKKLAQSQTHYKKGLNFKLNLDEISKMTGIDFSKYEPKKTLLDSPEINTVIKAFYKNKQK